MKRIILILVSVLCIGTVMSSCSSGDKAIEKQVTTLLSAYADTKAEVKDGVLTLSGDIESDEAKAKVLELLGSVKGIKSVVSNLNVKAPAVLINADTTINSAISAALSTGGFAGVAAQVKDGEVTLTGDIDKADLVKVMQIINETNPKKVINQLNLK